MNYILQGRAVLKPENPQPRESTVLHGRSSPGPKEAVLDCARPWVLESKGSEIDKAREVM